MTGSTAPLFPSWAKDRMKQYNCRPPADVDFFVHGLDFSPFLVRNWKSTKNHSFSKKLSPEFFLGFFFFLSSSCIKAALKCNVCLPSNQTLWCFTALPAFTWHFQTYVTVSAERLSALCYFCSCWYCSAFQHYDVIITHIMKELLLTLL